MEVFSYLSVLVSIVLGLGIAHLLGALIRLITNRARIVLYWPSLVWVINLLLIMLLVWWSDFSLTTHREGWTFAIFVMTLTVPSILYVLSGLMLPPGVENTRQAYEENRVWFFSLLTAAIYASFLQTFLLDGHIAVNADSGLKLIVALLVMVPIFIRNDFVQKAVAVANLFWTLFYISLLFSSLPKG